LVVKSEEDLAKMYDGVGVEDALTISYIWLRPIIEFDERRVDPDGVDERTT